jgi:hypothetical protein
MRSRQGLDDLARFDDGLDADAFGGAAVVFADDDVLRHVHRAPRQPESAVFGAVSAKPLRAPCVEMKYRSRLRPSRKLAVMGVLDDLAGGLGHLAAHAGNPRRQIRAA